MELGKWIGVFLLCAVKFVVGAPAAFLTLNLTFWEMVLFTSSGGIFGVFSFMFISSFLLNLINLIVFRIKGKREPQKEKPKKKIFTRKNRMYVKIIRKYGLPGLAFLTPTIISIPVGTFLAVRFFPNKLKVFVFLSSSVVLWALIISFILFLT